MNKDDIFIEGDCDEKKNGKNESLFTENLLATTGENPKLAASAAEKQNGLVSVFIRTKVKFY